MMHPWVFVKPLLSSSGQDPNQRSCSATLSPSSAWQPEVPLQPYSGCTRKTERSSCLEIELIPASRWLNEDFWRSRASRAPRRTSAWLSTWSAPRWPGRTWSSRVQERRSTLDHERTMNTRMHHPSRLCKFMVSRPRPSKSLGVWLRLQPCLIISDIWWQLDQTLLMIKFLKS